MMAAEKDLITKLKSEFGKNPFVSNAVFALLLTGVERMFEVEFACPCSPGWNRMFVFPFFLIPAVTSSLLMMLSQENTNTICKKVLCSCLPPIVWMALMLLNGQYLVCAETDWTGTFVTADKTYLKWCKPTNATTNFEEKQLRRSHILYIRSQGAGNAMITVLLFLLIVYIVHTTKSRCRQNDEEDPDAAAVPLQHQK
ncbi:calcium homeostasis modulator protein 6-like [Thunnus maccoyii]|uniref:calcium homeostasis modulator protein 6-like n=1 Tax=Thunnus maccoyii TaxID=8240 RepID=UPI001C4B6325|nr:calcium homeostasis modulator protein 6-like [Thunnus maccoyii]